jgi:hypothetical protein
MMIAALAKQELKVCKVLSFFFAQSKDTRPAEQSHINVTLEPWIVEPESSPIPLPIINIYRLFFYYLWHRMILATDRYKNHINQFSLSGGYCA